MAKRYYNPSDIQKILGLSRNTVYKYLADGSINSVRVGHGKYLIPAREVSRLQGEMGIVQTTPSPAKLKMESVFAKKSGWKNILLDQGVVGEQGVAADLFDWMVSLTSILLGTSLFLFSYYQFDVSRTWQVAQVSWIRYLLVLYGVFVTVVSLKRSKQAMGQVVDLVGAIIWGWMSYIMFMGGQPQTSVVYLAFVVTLIAGAVWKNFNAKQKFGLFFSFYFIAGAIAYKFYPSYFTVLMPLPVQIDLVRFYAWMGFGLVYMVGFLLLSKKFIAFLGWSVLASLAFLYTAFEFAHFSAWDKVLVHVMVGVFALFVPYANLFEITWEKRRREVAGEVMFVLVRVMIIGLILGGVNSIFRGHYYGADIEGDATSLANQIGNVMTQGKTEITTIAGSSLVSKAIAEHDTVLLDSFLKDMTRTSSLFMQYALWTKDGDIVTYYPRSDDEKLLAQNAGFRDYFQTAKEGKVYMSDQLIRLSVSGNPWALIMAAPIYDKTDHKVAGVVSARVDLERLQKYVATMRLEEGEHIILIDSIGRIIASKDELQATEMADKYLETVIARGHVSAEGEIPSIAYVEPVEGAQQAGSWVTWRPIPNSPWKVIVQQNAGKMSGLFEGIIVIFLLVTIVVSLLGIMGIRQYFSVISMREKLGKNGTTAD